MVTVPYTKGTRRTDPKPLLGAAQLWSAMRRDPSLSSRAVPLLTSLSATVQAGNQLSGGAGAPGAEDLLHDAAMLLDAVCATLTGDPNAETAIRRARDRARFDPRVRAALELVVALTRWHNATASVAGLAIVGCG